MRGARGTNKRTLRLSAWPHEHDPANVARYEIEAGARVLCSGVCSWAELRTKLAEFLLRGDLPWPGQREAVAQQLHDLWARP